MSCCPEELHETCSVLQSYWIVLATEENALLALLPTKRTVPTTSTKITAVADQANCADNEHQDYSQHHRIFRDVLTCFVSFRGRSNITLLSWLECFRFSGLADEKIRILTLNTRNQLVSS